MANSWTKRCWVLRSPLEWHAPDDARAFWIEQSSHDGSGNEYLPPRTKSVKSPCAFSCEQKGNIRLIHTDKADSLGKLH